MRLLLILLALSVPGLLISEPSRSLAALQDKLMETKEPKALANAYFVLEKAYEAYAKKPAPEHADNPHLLGKVFFAEKLPNDFPKKAEFSICTSHLKSLNRKLLEGKKDRMSLGQWESCLEPLLEEGDKELFNSAVKLYSSALK